MFALPGRSSVRHQSRRGLPSGHRLRGRGPADPQKPTETSSQTESTPRPKSRSEANPTVAPYDQLEHRFSRLQHLQTRPREIAGERSGSRSSVPERRLSLSRPAQWASSAGSGPQTPRNRPKRVLRRKAPTPQSPQRSKPHCRPHDHYQHRFSRSNARRRVLARSQDRASSVTGRRNYPWQGRVPLLVRFSCDQSDLRGGRPARNVRYAQQRHARLGRCAAPFLQVAGAARYHQVFPGVRAAARARHHVIQIQLALTRAAPAVLTLKAVTDHQVLAREPHHEARGAVVAREV